MRLVSESESVHYLLIDMHHIISDGASVGILIDELSILYRGDELDELPIQYKDYAVWSNSEESLVKKRLKRRFG